MGFKGGNGEGGKKGICMTRLVKGARYFDESTATRGEA
jgi:hypothetical protein